MRQLFVCPPKSQQRARLGGQQKHGGPLGLESRQPADGACAPVLRSQKAWDRPCWRPGAPACGPLIGPPGREPVGLNPPPPPQRPSHLRLRRPLTALSSALGADLSRAPPAVPESLSQLGCRARWEELRELFELDGAAGAEVVVVAALTIKLQAKSMDAVCDMEGPRAGERRGPRPDRRRREGRGTGRGETTGNK